MDGMRRDYARPPIQEALCHFTFSEPLDWNMATPGLVYQQIRELYPAPPEQQEQIQASVGMLPAEPGAAGFTLNKGPVRAFFKDPTGAKILLLDANSFSANSLQPYEGWDSLYARTQNACEALAATELIQPVKRVAVRYVNRIVIPDPNTIDLDDYFNIPVHGFQSDKSIVSAFLTRVESQLQNRDAVAITTFASAQNEPQESGASFLLDLEIYRENTLGWSYIEALEVAKELKLYENNEFETLITPATRELFK
jgi:uncharacterized protein (TIGR04255 family)